MVINMKKRLIMYSLLMIILVFSVKKTLAAENTDYFTIGGYVGLMESYAGESITDDELSHSDAFITKAEAAYYTNIAYENTYGTSYDDKLYNQVKENGRISDLNKIDVSYRDSVVKCFIRGIMVGDSEGAYTQSRKFKGKDFLSVKEGKNILKCLKDEKSRRKISSDGQLIRTTKLPRNYADFPYILEAFPNGFYEKKFEFMSYLSNPVKDVRQKTMSEIIRSKGCLPVKGAEGWYKSKKSLFGINTYQTPADIKKGSESYYDFSDDYEYKYTLWNSENEALRLKWAHLVEDYINHKYSVNYKTIDKKWDKEMGKLIGISSGSNDLKQYIKNVKANKVIIELKQVTVEPSTLYNYDGYYMRAYVKYRVKSANSLKDLSKVFLKDYSGNAEIKVKNLKKGKWMEMIIDIRFGTNIVKTNATLNDIEDYFVVSKGVYDYDANLYGKMQAPVSGYKMAKVNSGEYKGNYRWVLK